MTEPLKVLVWGQADQGPCSYYRGDQFIDVLRDKYDIELRGLKRVDVQAATEDGPDGPKVRVEVDKSEIEWADVLFFRRYYNTSYKCKAKGCGFLSHDTHAAAAHEHGAPPQDTITRIVWPAVRDHWTGGVVYDTDDDHFNIRPWNGFYREVLNERDFITEMARRADVVTVATPQLARQYGRFNPNLRVIRNAIDPSLYVKDTERPDDPKVRLVYYGGSARMRDYAGRYASGNKADGGGYAYEAVEAHKKLLTRVFLGAEEAREVIETLFDEVYPYVEGFAAFGKALANLHGDIGIAPLGGDDFDRSKSELHWLEYALTDMAFIGQRYNGDGPYSVIRHGVDGLLARGAQEWHDSVKALASSPDLRADLAGRAKERVLAEYDYHDRAAEWADAFRYAAENARGAKAA